MEKRLVESQSNKKKLMIYYSSEKGIYDVAAHLI